MKKDASKNLLSMRYHLVQLFERRAIIMRCEYIRVCNKGLDIPCLMALIRRNGVDNALHHLSTYFITY